MHPFEKRGLGTAPFQFVGMEVRVGPIRYPNGVEVGAPGQPMGTCDHCGNGIKYCCIIRSADGRESVVGTDCIRKCAASDKPLADRAAVERRKIDRQNAATRREKTEAAAMADADHAAELLKTDHAFRAACAAKPHPMIAGRSLLDYFEWMFANAGTSGKIRIARMIRAEAAATVAAGA